MSEADYFPSCGSTVRLRQEDLNGPLGDGWRVDQMQVDRCERAAGHSGRCEAWVTATGIWPGETYTAYWIRWNGQPDKSATNYEWVTSPTCCDAQSPYGPHWCVRPEDHDGGHVFDE